MRIVVSHRVHRKVGIRRTGSFTGRFPSELRGIGDPLNTETPGRQFGTSDVYDATKTNWANLGNDIRDREVKIILELLMSVVGKVSHIKKEERKNGKPKKRYITNGARNTEENEIDPEQEGNETDPESMGDHRDVNYTGNGDESLSDLDWREVENYGTDSDVGKFLQNNEGTQGYEELQSPAGADVYKIFAKEQIARGGKGKTAKF